MSLTARFKPTAFTAADALQLRLAGKPYWKSTARLWPGVTSNASFRASKTVILPDRGPGACSSASALPPSGSATRPHSNRHE